MKLAVDLPASTTTTTLNREAAAMSTIEPTQYPGASSASCSPLVVAGDLCNDLPMSRSLSLLEQSRKMSTSLTAAAAAAEVENLLLGLS